MNHGKKPKALPRDIVLETEQKGELSEGEAHSNLQYHELGREALNKCTVDAGEVGKKLWPNGSVVEEAVANHTQEWGKYKTDKLRQQHPKGGVTDEDPREGNCAWLCWLDQNDKSCCEEYLILEK